MANQRTIATALGLTQATVSRALRGSPSVRPETRRRVEETARRLGYRPNPLVTSLMEHIRAGKSAANQGVIAILVNAATEKEWLRLETYRLMSEGFKRQARLRGYRTENFFLGREEMDARKLDRILFARGISGLVFAVPERPEHRPDDRLPDDFRLTWPRYAAATISYDWSSLPIDRVATDHRHNLTLAFTRTAARGYRRIGLVLPDSAFNPEDSCWLGGFLAHQHYLPRASRIPVFRGSPRTTPVAAFRQWHERWKPDALLCLLGEEYEWMHALGLSTDASAPPARHLALVCLNRPLNSRFSGVEENNLLVGERVCDAVISSLMHNERGLPEHPMLMLVKGSWVEGQTLPAQNPGALSRVKK